MLFQIEGENLKKINTIDFRLEKYLQKMAENNLNEIFKLKFISTEFQLDNLRIDTLAFDPETKSFIIIEYKKTHNSGLIDQGYSYLALLLNNKAEFILEYNETQDENLKRDDVDWSQSKVIFVSPRFSTHQIKSIEFEDLPFELWEVSLYEKPLINFKKVEPAIARDSIKTVRNDSKKIKMVTQEVKNYSEEDHLNNVPDEIKEIYSEIKERILDWSSNIEIKPTKLYVAFYSKRNFIYTFLDKSQIKIVLNLKEGELKDPNGIARNVSQVGHQGNGDYRIHLKPTDDLDEVLLLIKQAFKKN